MSVCEKFVGGLCLTSSSLLDEAETLRHVGDSGWMGQLVGTGRGMLATLLAGLGLLKVILAQLNLHLNSYIYNNEDKSAFMHIVMPATTVVCSLGETICI